jgi:hypothetical protein
MAHYLFRLLGDRDPFSAILAGGLGGPEGGRMGDYVFDQEGKPLSLLRLRLQTFDMSHC